MRRFGLLGYPLIHSHSPKMMTLLARHHKWELSYEPFATPERDLPGFVEAVKSLPLSGFNVTVPHKQTILAYCDDLDPEVKAIQAANTIVNHAGRLKGHNTDLFGFGHALDTFSSPQPFAQALLLGAGGAARAAAYVLAQKGTAHLVIAARDVRREMEWRTDFPSLFQMTDVTFHPLDPAAMAPLVDDSSLIVQCTPLGTHPRVHEVIPFPFASLRDHHQVLDMVYNPAETAFLRAAQEQGAQTQNGLAMLVAQAVASLQIWGYETEYKTLESILTELLEN